MIENLADANRIHAFVTNHVTDLCGYAIADDGHVSLRRGVPAADDVEC